MRTVTGMRRSAAKHSSLTRARTRTQNIFISPFRQRRYCLIVGILSVGLLVGLWAGDAVHQVHFHALQDAQQSTEHRSGPGAPGVSQYAHANTFQAGKTNASVRQTASKEPAAGSIGAAVASAAEAAATAANALEAAGKHLKQHQQQQSQQKQQQQQQADGAVTSEQVQVQVTLTRTGLQTQQPHLMKGSLIPASSISAADAVGGTSVGSPAASKPLNPPAAQGSLRQGHENNALAAGKTQTRMAAAASVAAAAAAGGAAGAHQALVTVTGPPPKVALLFLTTGGLATDAIWKAFFQAAARLQVQPAVAAAAAKAAEHSRTVTAADAVGQGKAMHPDVGMYVPWAYPGYRLQHDLPPEAAPPPGQPRYRSLQATMIAAAARLVRKFAAANNADAPGQPRVLQQQQQQEQQAWKISPQLSDVRQALQVAALRGILIPTAGGNTTTTTTSSSSSSSTSRSRNRSSSSPTGTSSPNQPQASGNPHHHRWHVNHARCMANLGYRPLQQPTLSRVDPAHQPTSQQQHQLFSVYAHTPAGVLLPSSSVLSGCELPVRLNTTGGYAQHVLAEAAALLLADALSDPLNTKFVLLSDTSIPLYIPQVVWAQLIVEPTSRLDACLNPGHNTMSYRWRPEMQTQHFGRQHWRKSSQWFMLSRPHAQLAVADTHVREMLHRYCYTHWPRICVSDEHWLPSLLASYGLDNQTDCEGSSHYTDWSAGGWHPRSFTAEDLTPDLVTYMRMGIASGWATQELAGQQQDSVDAAKAQLAAAAAQCRSADAITSASESVFQPLRASSSATAAAAQMQQRRRTIQSLHPATGPKKLLPSNLQALLAASAAGGGNSTWQQDRAGAHHKFGQHWLLETGYMPLSARCPLFARKFPAEVQQELLTLALSCEGLGLGAGCS